MKRILIVDDSLTVILSLKNSLEILGYSVLTANNGSEAILRLNGPDKIDLIITDLNMPIMNGLELISKIKQMTKYRFTPILILSTENGTGGAKQQAKDLGATGWLIKPVSSSDLDKTIKQLLP